MRITVNAREVQVSGTSMGNNTSDRKCDGCCEEYIYDHSVEECLRSLANRLAIIEERLGL